MHRIRVLYCSVVSCVKCCDVSGFIRATRSQSVGRGRSRPRRSNSPAILGRAGREGQGEWDLVVRRKVVRRKRCEKTRVAMVSGESSSSFWERGKGCETDGGEEDAAEKHVSKDACCDGKR